MAEATENMLPPGEEDLIEVPDDLAQQLALDEEPAEDKQEEPASEDSHEEDSHEEDEESRHRRRNRRSAKARIGELTRQRNEEAEARAAAEAKLELQDEELRELRKKPVREEPVDNFEKEERNLLDRRRKATDDADLTALNDVNDQLTELRMKRLRQQVVAPKREEPQRRDVVEKQERHPAAQKWLDDNKWFSDSGNDELKREALYLQTYLQRQGYPLSPALYAELDRQLEMLPDYKKLKGNGEDPDADQPKRTVNSPTIPTAKVAGDDDRTSQDNTRELTDYDKKVMKQFKLDPMDAKHRAAYLKRRRGRGA